MTTILHRLAAWSESEPDAIAQTFKKKGKWKPITVKQFCDRVYWLALYFESQGMSADDVGTILAYNSPEWVHADLAALLLGAKSAGIYPNSIAKDIHYVLSHTESKYLSVQNKEYFNKLTDDHGNSLLPKDLKLLLVFDGDTSISPLAVSYQQAIQEGKKLASKEGSKTLKHYLDKIEPDQGAFLIYTSGTTGSPKGAMLSHQNLVYTIDRGVAFWGLTPGNGSLFSFLPLCHIAEKLQNLGGGIALRYTVNFCSQFDLVSKELPEVEPTLLLCVPRLWEKMMEGVMKKVDHSPLHKKQLALWAFRVGAAMGEARVNGKRALLKDWLQWQLADRLVLSKIRKALGLEKAQALVSGAAALPAQVCRWFRSLGLDIVEDFGQTESSGVICMTEKGVDCIGTVGKPVPGMEIKIAADGEILTRGNHVFKGYFKNESATAEVLQGGWLHTGDLGEMDPQGRVRIRGRKKEILKTSGGKMVAPLPIEEALKEAPLISQVCMVGDGRKFLSALITLSESKLEELSKSQGTLSGKVVTVPAVVKEVKGYVDQLNSTLANYEQIKKFVILSKEFSVNEGEMTPTLKMKRNIIEKRYQEVIEPLYL